MANDDHMMASVAGRYASALFDLATEQRALPDVEMKLASLQAMLNDSEDLRRLVKSPVFSALEQGQAVGAVLDKAGIDGLAGNFVRLIARNRRLFVLDDMLKNYRLLMARQRGEVTADVTSASPLTDAQRQALIASLSASVGGKTVRIDTKIDPSILGGLIVKIGSRMIDSSLKTKLNSLKSVMKEVR